MPLDKAEEDALRVLLSKNIDLKGRRIVNAGKSQNSSDYVTKEEVRDLVLAILKELNLI